MNILIMSDIHGNIEALKSVNEYLKNQKIDKLMLLGDIIDYGPHSNEVIEFISNLPYEIICNIWGNHEEAIIKEEYEKFSSNRGRVSAMYTRSILNENSWKYLNNDMNAITMMELEIHGRLCLAVHGSLADTAWKAIKPGQDLSQYAKYDYVFSGHSHFPHIFAEYYEDVNPEYRNKKRTMFINPGSVGQPRNFNPRAQFMLWNTDTDEIRMCCVDYDIKKEQEDFSDEIDVFYRDRLTKGV